MHINDYPPSLELYEMISGRRPAIFSLPAVMHNSSFYPNADLEWDIDGDPLRLFADKFHSFVFTVQGVGKIFDLKRECSARGCGTLTRLIHQEELIISEIKCNWSLWRYKNSVDNGIGFSLFVMESSSELAFDKTYALIEHFPKMVSIICRPGQQLFGLPNWFYKSSPEFVLYGGFDNKGVYNKFFEKNYELIAKPHPQFARDTNAILHNLHLFQGIPWEKLNTKDSHPSRGEGKKLRLFQKSN